MNEHIDTKRMPKGCDYQGRWPQAAECCTELGSDEEHDQHEGWGAVVIPVLLVFGCLAVVLLAPYLVGVFK